MHEIIEHAAEVLLQLTPDVIEHVLEAIDEGHIDLSTLGPDDILDIVTPAVAFAGGKALQRYMKQHPDQVREAVRHALAAL